MAQEPWYQDGLRFECIRCGRCCSGVPGYVWVSGREIAALAERLGMEFRAFRIRYTRRVNDQGKHGISLTEKKNQDCIFFDADRGCLVYEDRPRQCRSWPYWSSVIVSPQIWEDESERCPGINRGPLHSAEEIKRTAEDDGLP